VITRDGGQSMVESKMVVSVFLWERGRRRPFSVKKKTLGMSTDFISITFFGYLCRIGKERGAKVVVALKVESDVWSCFGMACLLLA